MPGPSKISLKKVLDALLDGNTPLNPRYLYRLSDLMPEEVGRLEKVWPKIPAWRRKAMLEDLEELGEGDDVLSYESVGRIGLGDAEGEVRARSVRLLWGLEERDLISIFIMMMEEDPSVEARAAAAYALGSYVYLGEIEELPERLLDRIVKKLVETASGQDDPQVRRKALEALGFSSHEELDRLIQSAYQSKEPDWQVSALNAMGRSGNQRWNLKVLEMLDHPAPEIRLEAVRAAGELEINEAVRPILDLVDGDDQDVRQEAIWSLSKIGGEGVREKLQLLHDTTDDEDEAELIEDALENLEFTEDLAMFSLLNLEEDPFISKMSEEKSLGKKKGNGTGDSGLE